MPMRPSSRCVRPAGGASRHRPGPLKAIVGAMVDLLTDPRRAPGPIVLSSWEAHRLEALHLQIDASLATRAGEKGAWQVQGDAGLWSLVERLRAAGEPPAVTMPTGLGLQLRAYQQHGVAWLQYLREHDLAGILADDMGLGKTAQVLAHLLKSSNRPGDWTGSGPDRAAYHADRQLAGRGGTHRAGPALCPHACRARSAAQTSRRSNRKTRRDRHDLRRCSGATSTRWPRRPEWHRADPGRGADGQERRQPHRHGRCAG